MTSLGVSHPNLPGPVLKHIPKSARPACCSALTDILLGITRNNRDVNLWDKLLHFAPTILLNPPKVGSQVNVTDVIKRRISGIGRPITSARPRSHRPAKAFDLAAAVTSKVEDGNIKAAIRLLNSDDKPASFNEEVFAQLQARHPPAVTDSKSPPDPSLFCPLQVSEADVLRAIRSFPAGSSGGPDGFKPQHLLELTNCPSNGSRLLTAVAGFVNMVLDGGVPSTVMPVFFGGRLIALEKKSGGFRPIAVGYTFRRLVAKCANTYAQKQLSSYFSPTQLGVAVSGGCEAAVHATRRFLLDMATDDVLVKLDFSNAFNTVRRDVILNNVAEKLPELYRLCWSAYSVTSLLKFSDKCILSREGVQQGDPLGPLLFCLALQPILTQLTSKLKIGYLDDVTLGGHVNTVDRDVAAIKSLGDVIGLQLNRTKCEIIAQSPTIGHSSLSDFIVVTPQEATLLGAPLLSDVALETALTDRCNELTKVENKLSLISAHDALLILKSSLGTPKMTHLLRSSPCTEHQSLGAIDDCLRNCVGRITNTSITDSQWEQASLPVKAGGLGIRRASHLAPSAFLAASSSTADLQCTILQTSSLSTTAYEESARSAWCTMTSSTAPVAPQSHRQQNWDKPMVEAVKSRLLSMHDNKARLLAVTAVHSGEWLNALPISNCGLRLSDEAIRTAVSLRLGSSICLPHQCPCGTYVDALGSHVLSCKKSSARILRHNELNDIVHRSLVRAGIPSVKEPPGLLRSDGKRPDGCTQIPWSAGKCLAWDVTVTDTLAPSYAHLSSVSAGSVAERAAERKIVKYAGLEPTHTFMPIAMETLGPFNQSALSFLTTLGRKLSAATGDPRESSFLFQRLSIAIQRFNCIALHDSFASDIVADDLS